MKGKIESDSDALDVTSAVLPKEEIRRQAEMLQQREWALSCFDCVTDVVMVFNHLRQLVYMNINGLRMLNQESPDKLLGLRFGEIFGCINARKSPGGCGLSPACKECGSLHALVLGTHGESKMVECRLLLEEGNDAVEWLCKSSPVVRNGEAFTVLAITDISDQKRRRVLEKILLNDVMNTAGGLKIITDMLKELYTDHETYFSMLEHTSNRLINEIEHQNVLVSGELGSLKVQCQSCDVDTILSNTRFYYLHHAACDNRTIRHELLAEPLRFLCDPDLLTHAHGCLVVNALEACDEHEQVTLSASHDENMVQFLVHNPGGMSDEIQHQIFQRSFSTKGSGRGMGTYFAKLISETYLQGTVTFESSPEAGTTFTLSVPRTPKLEE